MGLSILTMPPSLPFVPTILRWEGKDNSEKSQGMERSSKDKGYKTTHRHRTYPFSGHSLREATRKSQVRTPVL